MKTKTDLCYSGKASRKKIVHKRVLSLMLGVILLVSLIPTVVSADATASFYNKLCPIECYPWENESFPSYTSTACTTKAGTIYTTDLCTITNVYYTNSTWVCKVKYPLSGGGTKTAYAKFGRFIKSPAAADTSPVTAAKKVTVSTKSGTAALSSWYISKGDKFYVVRVDGSRTQVAYPISGGYKLGWINNYTVKYNANGGSGAPAAQTKTQGVNLTLSKTTPSLEGHAFQSWNTAKAGSGTKYAAGGTYSADSSATLYAQWDTNRYTLTVKSNDTSLGTVSGGGTYDYNTKVTIKATPKTGCSFIQWSDGNTSATRTITVTKNLTLTATFKKNTYSFSAKPNDTSGGTVTITPSKSSYEYNEKVTIKALPNAGYSFSNWSDGDTNATRTITITKALTLTAVFTQENYSITVKSDNDIMGTASKNPDKMSYLYNDNVNLTAVPKEGYSFSGWSDGNTEANRTITVRGNAVYTAYFKLNSYDKFEAKSGDNSKGTVKIEPNKSSYDYNDEVTITAIPNEGYSFTRWSDGDTNAQRTIIVKDNTAYIAYFTANEYSVDIKSENINKGTVTINPAGTVFEYGSSISIAAVPKNGYTFSHWSDGDANAQRNIVVKENISYTAYFKANEYTVSAVSENANKGAVVVEPAKEKYEYNQSVTITAMPNDGYSFSRWSDGDTSAVRTITVTGAVTLTAYFIDKSYAISVHSNDTSMGTVSGGGNYKYNEKASITAIPKDGYSFSHWSDGSKIVRRTITVTEALELTAYFTKNSYEINLNCNDDSMGTVSGAGTYDYNANVTIAAVPKEGHSFSHWSDGNTTPKRTITVTQSLSLTANFLTNYYNLTVESADEDKGTVSGDGTYPYDEEVEIEAIPKEGHSFSQWSDGDKNLKRKVTVKGDMSYKALFAANKYKIEAKSDDANKGSVTINPLSEEYEYNTEINLTANPKDGYSFRNWSDGEADAVRTLKVKETTSLTAHFVGNEYLITFNPAGGTVDIPGKTVRYYESYGEMPVPEKGLYIFDGWFTEETGGTRVENNTRVLINQDQILYAHWNEPSDHIYGEWVIDKEPTCDNVGKRHRVCIDCGNIEEDIISPTGHLYSNEWIVIKQPTCTEEGEEARVCEYCEKQTDNRAVKKLEHEYGEWTIDTEATCTEAGHKHRECYNCEDIQHEEIEPIGHNYTFDKLISAPTPEKPGQRKLVCDHCKKTYVETFRYEVEEGTIVIEDAAAITGGEMTLSAKLWDNPGFTNFNVKIDYDKNVLIPKNIDIGDSIKDKEGTFTSNLDQVVRGIKSASDLDSVTAVWQYGMGENNVEDKDVELFTVTFDVNAAATTGTYSVSLSYEGEYPNNSGVYLGIIDCDGNQVMPKLSEGAVTVTGGVIRGDVNQDLRVDGSDRVYLARKIVGWRNLQWTEHHQQAGDLFKDGRINTKDGVRLAQLLAGYSFDSSTEEDYLVELAAATDDNVIELSAERVFAKPGEVIDVPVVIKNNPGIAGLKLSLLYDKAYLTPISVINGEYFNSKSTSNLQQEDADNSTPDSVNIYWADKENLQVDGELAVVSFVVNDNVTVGQTIPIELKAEDGDVCRISETSINTVKIAAVDGEITIADDSGLPPKPLYEKNYNIENIMMKTSDGTEYNEIPFDEEFMLNFDLICLQDSYMPAQIIIAQYDYNEHLLALRKETLTEEIWREKKYQCSLDNNEELSKLKLFIWDSMNGMRPLSDVSELY